MEGKQKSQRRFFLGVVFFLTLLFCTYVVGGCAKTSDKEGTQEPAPTQEQTTGKESPGGQETGPESKPEPTKEKAAEASPEPTKEKVPEPIAEKTDAGSEPPVADTSDGGPSTPCTGVRGPYPDVTATAPPESSGPETPPETPDDVCKHYPAQCPGSDMPVWKLEDFQPQSCGHKKSYSLQAFKGTPIVAVMLSGW